MNNSQERPQTDGAAGRHDDAYVRLATVLRKFPVGESTWNKGGADGRYPKPVKLSARVVAYKVSQIRELLAAVRDRDRR